MAERVAHANKLLVLHPRFREAVALLENCHQSSKQAGEPVCGAILGSSAVGKTSAVDHYRRPHPPRETDTANCQPVLKGTLQPDTRHVGRSLRDQIRVSERRGYVIPPGAAARSRV